jgi:hypothetical protein
MTSNEEFHKRILENKSAVSKSSLISYTSMLRNIYYKAHGTNRDDPIDFDWFFNEREVLKSLEDKEPAVRKTYLSAILALVGKSHKKYNQLLKKDVEVYNKFVDKQEMTQKQKENWKSFEDVKKIVKKYELQAKQVIKQPSGNAKKDREIMEDWLILALTTGVYFPPRRSLDWVNMKFRGFSQESEDYNYMDLKKNKFVFNIYKTANKYGRQEVKIKSRIFKKMVQSYLEMIPDGVDTLLNDLHWEKYTSIRLTQRLNKIFDSHISTSMLRHIYLSSALKDAPPLEHLKELAKQMGHSIPQQLEYIKR